MSYVDARLHLPILPPLERFIPVVGEVVRKVLLGDEAVSQAHHALTFMPPRIDATSLPPLPAAYREDAERVGRLLDMHMQRSSREWTAHLRQLKRSVKALTERLRRQRTARNHPELTRTLEAELQRLREAPLPNCRRCAELVEACSTLKAAFSRSYGSERTAQLLQTREAIERHVCYSQNSSLDQFLHDVQELLRPS